MTQFLKQILVRLRRDIASTSLTLLEGCELGPFCYINNDEFIIIYSNILNVVDKLVITILK